MTDFNKPIKIDKSQARQVERLIPYFEGVARQQNLTERNEKNDIMISAVFFEPGARNRPHIHEHNQVLQVLYGTAVVVIEDTKHIVSAGEVITIPGGAWHWHGATHDAEMCHISTVRSGAISFDVEERNWASDHPK